MWPCARSGRGRRPVPGGIVRRRGRVIRPGNEVVGGCSAPALVALGWGLARPEVLRAFRDGSGMRMSMRDAKLVVRGGSSFDASWIPSIHAIPGSGRKFVV